MKWQKFERLVAAINATKMKGADVKWDDKIEGRQFDVTIRFRTGDYDYLTVVECKDYSSKVPVEKVEAFVTKSNGVKASKAVMFSSSGFQSGCITVAEQHGVDLFTLSEIQEIPQESLTGLLIPAGNIHSVRLIRYGKKSSFEFGDGPKLPYLMLNTRITQPREKDATLNTVLAIWVTNNFESLSTNAKTCQIDVPRNTIISVPEVGQLNDVKIIEFKAGTIQATITTTLSPDPYLITRLNRKILIEEHLTGKKSEVKFSDIDHGFDTTFSVGQFYHSPTLGFDYYCEKIEKDLITWLVLETYQHGLKLDARITQKTEHAKDYVETTDRKKLTHLKQYLKKFYRNERKNR